jgi:hypothetical protein
MRSMNVSHILCAVLACASLTLVARASASSEDGRWSAAANAGAVAARAAPTRETSSKAGHTGALDSTQMGVRTGGSSKSRDAAVAGSPRRGSVMPRRGTGQAASGNAERLHALQNAQARGRFVRHPGRPVGSTHAATGALGVRGPYGVRAAGQSTLAASNRTVSPAPRLTATPRDSTIGGPHVQSAGRLGGPVIGRTNHSAAIDGTEFRRKF